MHMDRSMLQRALLLLLLATTSATGEHNATHKRQFSASLSLCMPCPPLPGEHPSPTSQRTHALLRLSTPSPTCSEADTKKYCCLRRSSLPSGVASLGYSTALMADARSFSMVALM